MNQDSIKEILEEFYVKRNFPYYVAYFLKNERELEALINLSLQSKEEKYCIMGTWLCAHIAETDNTKFTKYYDQIVLFLQTESNQSSLRNWMKVLSFLTIPETFEGEVIDLCVKAIENTKNKVALQVYSIQVLIPLMKKHPTIIPEIIALLDLHSEGKSAAFHSISRKFKKNTLKFLNFK